MPTIKYGSNIALIGPSPSDSDHIGKVNYLRLVQGFGLNINSNNKNVIGIGSRGEVDQKFFPESIDGSIEYYLSDGVNEKLFGLTVESPFDQLEAERNSVSNGLLQKGGVTTGEQRISTNNNIFLLTSKDFDDAINTASDDFTVLALGNCYVNSYNVSFSIGGIPTANIGFSCETFYLKDYVPHSGSQDNITNAMNVPAIKQEDGSASDYGYVIDHNIFDIYDYSGGVYDPLKATPNVIEEVSTNTMDILISGDSIGVLSGSSSEDNKCFQSLELSLNLPRYEHRSLKSKYVHDRPLLFPCVGSVSVSLIVDEFSSGDSRTFSREPFDIHLTLKGGGTSGEYNEEFLNYQIKSAKLESQSFSQGIGGSLVWNANFSFFEGESTDLFYREEHSGTNGLFMSGLPEIQESKIIYEKGIGAIVSESGWLNNTFPAFIELS